MLHGIIIIILSAVITDNVVLSQSLGICPFLGVSNKTSSAVGMGLAVSFVLCVGMLACWVLNTALLVPLELEYLSTLVFILILAALVQMLDIFLKRFSDTLYNSLGVYLALITTNCAVLGSAIIIVAKSYTALESVIYGASVGLGFTLALVLMAGVRERLKICNIPKPFRGTPIVLIAAGLMSMAFLGLSFSL